VKEDHDRPAVDVPPRTQVSGEAPEGGAPIVFETERALRAITAQVLLMPCNTDLYFRLDDNARELPMLARGQLVPIESDWGHRAGNPVHRGPDEAFIRDQVHALLAR
jgi:hypothetical protein